VANTYYPYYAIFYFVEIVRVNKFRKVKLQELEECLDYSCILMHE